tara:strand:- start:409 stop:627 length:219 start_codon:yes stop_codon:yes gene_type:complete
MGTGKIEEKELHKCWNLSIIVEVNSSSTATKEDEVGGVVEEAEESLISTSAMIWVDICNRNAQVSGCLEIAI